MLTEESQNIINGFLEATQKLIIANHIAYGQRTSGKFIKGLEVLPTENGGQLVDNAGYSYFLEYGRGPTKSSGGGSGSLLSLIQNWFDAKGLSITKQFNPYSVTAKIHKEGTSLYRTLGRTGSGSGVITGAINDKAINDMFMQFSDMFHKDAFSEVSKELTI